MSYNSKYSGEQVEQLLDQVASGNTGGSVDSELSDTSENPVQNKVIKSELDSLTKEIVDNEEVTAGALNSLNDRVTDLTTLVQDNYTENKTAIEEGLASVNEEIIKNEEVTAAALTDLDNKINKKQDVLTDGENIKTINGESILGEGNIEMQGGGGVELLEVRYNWAGIELTDEDKAVNAATYAKLLENNNYIIFTRLDTMLIHAAVISSPTTDYPEMGVVLESSILSLMGMKSKMVTIDSSGNIIDAMDAVSNLMLELGNITSYYELNTILTSLGYTTGQYLGPILVSGNIKGIDISGYINTMLIDNSSITIQYQGIFGENGYIYATPDDLKIDIFNHGRIYFNFTDEQFLAYNIAAITYLDRATELSSFTMIDEANSSSYSVISGSITNGIATIVIYRNNTFETWQINADGTTQQITQ